MREPAYRLYNCQRCQVQVRICQRCDHGNLYCAGGCASIRRRESLRRAQARYQGSRRGAMRHAARQHQQIVTHQGSAVALTSCIVAISVVTRSPASDVSPDQCEPRLQIGRSLERCAFCGAALSAWTRQRPWYWSG
jgi:hypothetical protein